MNAQLKTVFFQDKPLYYLESTDGTNLVLIRPLCEALGVDADWQIRQLKADEMLAPEVCEHTTQVPSQGQARSWTCLPEEYIYGWVAAIQLTNTMRPETRANLIAYKRECYHILFEHFHGRLRQVQELDKEEAIINLELQVVEKRLQQKMQADPDHLRKLELEAKKKQLRKAATQNRQQSRQQAFEFALSVQEQAAEA